MTFDTWIRDVFRQNKPYDQFAKELLTATGSTWKNGAVTMYRDRRTPDELTKMVTQLFLGIRLECAKCHHHPFEVYSQDDFYSLAAYFSKVAFKGNGISAPISGGEEMVYVAVPGGRSQPVKHPLTNELMSPKPLFGKAPEIAEGADPRAALAEWMLSRDNPYFARAAANRVWGELMGRGIVDPVDDLRATNPPSNPELIAALAEDFRAHKFDHKHLLRTIANSHVYQLSSAPNSTNVGDTRNYSRYYRSRLRGETLLDAVSDLTQVPEDFRGMPPLSRATEIWTHRIDSLFLDAFGRPDPNQDPPCERPSEATMTQTLHLMNSPGMQKKVTHPKGRVAVLAASSKTTDEVVTELYLLTYSRPPTEAEKKDLEPYLKDLTPGTRAAVFEDLLWSLMNTPEFWFKN